MKLIIENEILKKEMDSELRAESINIYEINFEFSEEWNGLSKKIVFIKDERIYEEAILNDKAIIPPIPNGVYAVGVVGFIAENNIIVKRKSTNLKNIDITDSAAEYSKNQDITPEEIGIFESYIQILNGKIDEIDAAQQDLQDKVDSGYFKGDSGLVWFEIQNGHLIAFSECKNNLDRFYIQNGHMYMNLPVY